MNRGPRDSWIEHRRGDGELVGWMRPEGEGFVAVDLLGRDRSAAVEWLEAEELLDELGIGYLADAYLLRQAGDGSADGERGEAGDVAGGEAGDVRVRIVEVSTAGILVKRDDFGDVTASLQQFSLSWPMPYSLRPMTADELRTWSPW
ncbi:hypothetical protein N1028_11310 [Herbiconiux sp. CPCC 203407]|uniref:Uncharacterized protein n=1 Tax=Herbiconiux oxytropis TaxID=2970915 RepID=A0AA41XE32_9MICO|nr:hypothetical protein [Herbiconiux oxytropis]MCS5722541.1 hypothetical protein [Herbiconiux oxytropis]MCS5726481.1 hypothetical protein [Herbiconiux oxytropis]